MDLSKITNNKFLKITAIIALPTVLVAGYYGYKYFKQKHDDKKLSNELAKMREKYKEVNSVDELIEGIKYVRNPIQFGYDLSKIGTQKDTLDKMNFDDLKKFYELAKLGVKEKTESENLDFLDYAREIFN
jgi:hypothetical protein